MTTQTMAAPDRHGEAAAAPTARDLARLDADLHALERARALLREGELRAASDPRAAFELTHRAALKAAGVVIEQANRERRRRLPLNVWTALARCGLEQRRWAQEAAPFVAERARLDADSTAQPDPRLLAEHRAMTARRIEAIRGRTAGAALGPWAAPEAS